MSRAVLRVLTWRYRSGNLAAQAATMARYTLATGSSVVPLPPSSGAPETEAALVPQARRADEPVPRGSKLTTVKC